MGARVRFLEAAQDRPLLLGSAPRLPRVLARYQLLWQEALGAEWGVREGKCRGDGERARRGKTEPPPPCDIQPTPLPHDVFGEGLR